MNLIGDDDPPRAAVVLDELDATARAMHQRTIRLALEVERSYYTGAGVFGALRQRREPAGLDEDVIVDEDEVLPSCVAGAQVPSLGPSRTTAEPVAHAANGSVSAAGGRACCSTAGSVRIGRTTCIPELDSA